MYFEKYGILIWTGVRIGDLDSRGNNCIVFSGKAEVLAVSSTPEKFENEPLFVRLGLLFTPIRHEHGGISTRRLFVFVWTENICKRSFSKNMASR